MASGAKLPNTNLNLIQDIDMIDYADINAIAQAAEANSAGIGMMQLKSPIKYIGSTIADLNTTLEFEFLGYFTNGPSELNRYIYFNQQFYTSPSVDAPRRQFVQSYIDGRIFTRVKPPGQPFSLWREVGDYRPHGTLPDGTDLHTLRAGVYTLGNTGVYENGVGEMYGILTVTEASPRKFLTFRGHNNIIFIKTYSGTAWSDWRQI